MWTVMIWLLRLVLKVWPFSVVENVLSVSSGVIRIKMWAIECLFLLIVLPFHQNLFLSTLLPLHPLLHLLPLPPPLSLCWSDCVLFVFLFFYPLDLICELEINLPSKTETDILDIAFLLYPCSDPVCCRLHHPPI